MKAFFAVILFCALAGAEPRVGDMAAYDIEVTVFGQTFFGKMEVLILEIDGSFAKVRQTESFDGEKSTTEETYNLDNMFKPANVDELNEYCANSGGERVTERVQEEDIEACKVKEGENSGTYGLVPFGLIRQVAGENGLFWKHDLKAFQRGQ